jgi:hypothetical protein
MSRREMVEFKALVTMPRRSQELTRTCNFNSSALLFAHRPDDVPIKHLGRLAKNFVPAQDGNIFGDGEHFQQRRHHLGTATRTSDRIAVQTTPRILTPSL